MKAKEYLLAKGRIEKIGRGRISLDNHAFLKAAYDKGERFTDWPKGAIVESKDSQDKPVIRVKRDPNVGNEKVVQEYVVFYERDNYKAVADDGKVYGMAEVCNTCHVSLVQNHCDNPTILGDIAVTIKPRT